jgi:MFS family permease
LIGMAFGGLVADAHGWRTAFFLAGAPGVLLAVLAALTLKEPRRAAAARAAHAAAPSAGFRETVRYLAWKRSFSFGIAGIAIKAFIASGYAVFMASFFLRNHAEALDVMARQTGGLQPVGFVGVILGLLSGVFGALGMWCGGQLADRLAARDIRRHMYGPAVATLLLIPVFAIAVTTQSLPLALAGMGASAFIGGLHYGPAMTAVFMAAPPHMRATTSAISLFVSNMIGLGMGPLVVGVLSDIYAARLGPAEGLRWALLTASLSGVLAAACFWTGARTLREDVAI